MELHFQSSDISVSGNLLIPNPYRFYFQIFCISAVGGGQSAEPPLIFACSGGSPPNGEASETFLLHHFLLAEGAAPSGAQTPKLDTRASATTDAETVRLERRPRCLQAGDRCSRSACAEMRDRRSQRELVFTEPLNAAQELVNRGRRRDMRGGDFISVLHPSSVDTSVQV